MNRIVQATSFFLLCTIPVLAKAGSLTDPFGAKTMTSGSPGQEWSRRDSVDPCASREDPEIPWTLTNVIHRALCRNPQTREAWSNARRRASEVGLSRSGYLPFVTVTGAAERVGSSAGGSGPRVVQNRADESASLTLLLFDFGGREASVDQARAALDAANWTQNAVLQNVLFSTIQAYFTLFAAREAVEADRETERSSKEALDAAGFRYEVGAAALADKLLAQTAYSQARLTRQRAEGEAHIAEGVLSNLLGLDANHSIDLVPPVESTDPSVDRLTVDKLIEDAKRSRPDLTAAEAQVRQAKANVRIERASGLPNLSLLGNYGYAQSNLTDDSHNWSIGLKLNFPLFTAFQTTYRVRSAHDQVEVQEARTEFLEQKVALDVWRAYHSLNTARETVQTATDLLASARQSEQVALGRYKAGAGSILDLLSAQASLANARVQRIQAEYDWSVSRSSLAQAMGRLSLETALDPATPLTSGQVP